MKLIVIFSILEFVILFGCTNPTEKNERIAKDNNQEKLIVKQISFDEYLTAIPEIKLPLDIKCDVELDGSFFKFNSKTINKFGQENSKINGKIAQTDNFAAIIYLYPADIILPIIQTTDFMGNKISELKIYERWCGEDEFSWGTSWANISKDLTITLSDSVIIYKRNDKGEIIENSKVTEVRHRGFYIDKNGVINENKNKP
jgi:hypothetical protein